LDGGYSDLLDYVNRDFSGAQNILPVFVKANNPFDYANPAHIDAITKKVDEMRKEDWRAHSVLSDKVPNWRGDIKVGSWRAIENPQFQKAIKALGFDGFYVSEGGNKNLAVYDSNQIKSFTNQAPTESKDIRYSLKAPDTPEVDAFMNRIEGKSKIVNEDGTPKIYYHGTAQDITEFIPKQAKAIFLSPTPSFAEDFTDASEYYMAKKVKEGLSDDKLMEFAKKADKLAREYGDSPEEAMNQVLRDQLPSRANIIPAYIYANNPFDYENPAHIQDVLNNATPEEMQKMLQGASFDPERLKRIFGFGSWNMIESPEAQGAIKRAGFDGFYVTEGGQKNLAVYDSSQIKSAFNLAPTKESKDIRYSFNAPPETHTKLEAANTAGKRLTDSINGVIKMFKDPEERIKTRIAFIIRYSKDNGLPIILFKIMGI
jgi:hypothetical protein